MRARQPKSLLLSTLKWIVIGLFVSIGIVLVLGYYDDTFQFDIVNGSELHTEYSTTKREAVRRGTFVCDVITPIQPFKVSDTHIINITSGWIEQSWSGGFWHWTTVKDTGADIYYRVILRSTKTSQGKTEWHIVNKHIPGVGYVQLQDDGDRLTGTLESLPASDTLLYTVLKKDTLDFRPSNIDGTLILVLRRGKKDTKS